MLCIRSFNNSKFERTEEDLMLVHFPCSKLKIQKMINHNLDKGINQYYDEKSLLSWSILFLNKTQRRGIPQRLFDKCGHLFIGISLKRH